MKKKDIFIIIAAMLSDIIIGASIIISGFVAYEAGVFDRNDYSADTYDKMAKYIDVMPQTSEIGDYREVFTQYFHHNMIVFDSDSYTLVAKYDENEYEAQKRAVIENNVFVDWELKSDVQVFGTEPNFETDGFSFKTLIQSYEDYPHHLYFAGFNDSENEIAYIYFRDTDLDYIDVGFEYFIKVDCDWDINRINEKIGQD